MAEDLWAEDGMPKKCISAVTFGQTLYWCERGDRGHDGLCGGRDDFGNTAEWKWTQAAR